MALPKIRLDGLRSAAGSVRDRLRTHREKVGPKEFVRQFTYWLLLPTAFYTTWHGMNDIVAFNYPRAGLITLTITLLVALMLFVLMNYTLAVWRSYDGLLSRVSAIAVYLLTATLSVAFAFSFWWTVLSSRSRTAEDTEAGAAAIMRIASDAQNNLSSMQVSLKSIADYSALRAEEERTRGGTCGDRSGVGFGPRADRRNSDAQSFELASTDVGRFTAELSPQLEALRISAAAVEEESFRTGSDAGRRAVVAAVNRDIARIGDNVNRAKTDERLKTYQTQFEQRLAIGRDGWSSGGQLIRCPDPNLDGALNAAIASIRNVQAIPDFSGFRVPVVEGGEATMYAFDTFLNTGRIMLTGEPQDRVSAEAARQQVGEEGDRTRDEDAMILEALSSTEAGVITGTQWFSFFLAVFIDVGIAFVGFGKPLNPSDGLTGWLYGNNRGSRKAVRNWLNALQEMDGGLRSQVGPFHVALLGEDYLVVPAQPEQEPAIEKFPAAAFSVGHLAALLKAARLAQEVTPNNFMLRELHRRLLHNQRAHGSSDTLLALPAPPPAEPGEEGAASAANEKPRWRQWVDRAWNTSTGFLAAAFADETARDLRRQYRFFRTGRGVFDNLHLQSVARDMPEPPAA